MKLPHSPAVGEATEPDADRDITAPRTGAWRDRAPVLGVVALGGAIGASARYGAFLWWPNAAGGFPWTALVVNAAGCAVLGVFMVVLSDVWAAAHRLVRPFLGTGVLGGFTTFSTYAVDTRQLIDSDSARTGLAYLGLTPLAALTAVGSAAWMTRRIVTWRQT
ncbi:CrcB family protein [Streptomyces sp. NBC_01723]|uniref:FluC/FEX family fluoride channel n=1 Tax=Streptomyces sp. NBC_01723 TaxID=2975921 RepID=UPI002E2EF9AD|nr:CrcB family protein [Streptomyces sp. NBC_01723]